MTNLANRTYKMIMERDDAPEKIMICQRTNWEGLSVTDLLNMFRLFLLQIGYSDEAARMIQDLRKLNVEVTEELYIQNCDD